MFKIRMTSVWLSLFVLLVANSARASVTQVQPVDIVASPLSDNFSSATGAWPSQSYRAERLFSSGLSFFETLDRIPGVQTRGSLSKSSPGFILRGTESTSRVLGLYDDIPLNLADGIGTQSLLIPHESIGEVLVLKGPASVFFGSHAMAGAINFKSALYERTRARLTAGSFGQKSAFAAAPLVSNERHHVQLTAYNDSIDGNYPYFSLSNGERGRRTHTNTHTLRTTLSGEHIYRGYKVSYRGLHAKEQGASPGSVTSPSVDSQKKLATLFGAKLSKDVSSRVNVAAHSSYVQTESRFLTESSNSLYTSYAQQIFSGLKIDYSEPNVFSASILLENKSDVLKTQVLGNQTKTQQTLEPGVLFQFPFAEDILFQSGARYLPANGIVTKSAGLIKTVRNTKFWLTYTEGYKTPSLSQRYGSYSGTPNFVGNPNLKPEESEQIEIGASKASETGTSRLLRRLSYDLSVYSITYDNLISNTEDNTSNKNISFAKAFGSDISLGLPLELWSIEFFYSLIEATKQGSQPLLYFPDQRLGLAVAHYFGPLVFEFKNQAWMNYRYASGPNDKRSWITGDFTIRTLGLNDWSIQGGVLNLYNTAIEYIPGYPEPRLRYFVSVEKLF